MRFWILVAVLCTSLATAVTAAPGQKWAVLIGVDRYQRSDITPLQYAVADVRAVAKMLQQRCGFSPDNIFLMTTDQKGDNEPTRGNVAFRIGWLAEHVQPGDTVVVFFSGHGMQMDEASYLLTCDADARNATTLKQTGYSRQELQAGLRSLRAGAMLVVLDACRNDPRSGKGGGDNKMSAQMARDLVLQRRDGASYTATMFACGEGERSYEWADKGHGFFTWYFLQGLNGGAADAAGRVTLAGMRKYLTSEIPKATERVTGQRQVPRIVAFGSTETPVNESECVLAVVKGGKVAVDEGPHVTPTPHVNPSPSPEVAIDHSTTRPPATAAFRWVGTFSTHFPIQGVENYFERDNRANGTYTDYWIVNHQRYEVRSGVNKTFQDGRFHWHVVSNTKVDTLKMAGRDESGTYEVQDPNTVLLHYSPTGELLWTRIR